MANVAKMLTSLRAMLSDDDPEKNILDGRQEKFTEPKLEFFLERTLYDVNSATPPTNFTLETFPEVDAQLLVTGGIVQACIAEGLLQLRNNVAYSDSGLSVDIFNKTGAYQGWAGYMAQTYIADKTAFKRKIVANSFNGGFIGVSSPFHPLHGSYYR